MNSVLACRHLTKTFNETNERIDVLKGINLSIEAKAFVSIVGVSGSGKSTLLHLLGGLDQPTEGEVWVAGKNLSALSDNALAMLRNQHLGFIYQFHHLLPEFNALENVAMPLLLRRVPVKYAKTKAEAILVEMGLKDRLTHRTGELSGGERQRVAIARALVTEPLCVLADEPTGNLDQRTAEQVYETMIELNELKKTSFLIVTHNVTFAQKSQRILQLGNGQLWES
jgi:lipoprotein-releasing system ATP-binding protein